MSNHNHTVLAIDDDNLFLDIIRERLGREKINVITALDGQIGLSMAKSNMPDLILIDIMLKGKIHGFDVLEQLKRDSQTKDIPVIVLTNLDSEKKVAKEIGAADYFVKSNTDFGIINKRIKDILGEKAGVKVPSSEEKR